MDPLLDYVRSACDHPILSREEENRLARAYRAGDEEAGRTLVEHNQRLVYSIARSYAGSMPLLDAIQEGNLGLIHAIGKFDPGRGFKLSTYATWWIKQSIRRARQHDRVVRLPVHVQEAIEKLVRAEAAHPEASREELARVLHTTPEKLEKLMKTRQSVLSLDVGEDEEGVTFADTLADDSEDDVVSQVAFAQDWQRAQAAMKKLPARSRRILELRFGLDGRHERTLEEVGREIGLTRERVRQLEAEALKRLQARLAA